MDDPLFDFNPEAVAAELSSATNDEYLVRLEVPGSDPRTRGLGFSPVRSTHGAIADAAGAVGLPYEQGMDIPVDVVILAVENELRSLGCRLVRDDDPQAFEVLARWTWPPLR